MKKNNGAITHEDATIASFRKDPKFAAAYLDAVFADGDAKESLLALRLATEAFGGVAKVAERAKLNPRTLYRTLSDKGNPELLSFSAILRAMGMRIAIESARRSGRRMSIVERQHA